MPDRQPQRIAVLMGGPSAEQEVSRVSAAGVAKALEASFADVRCIELDGGVTMALHDYAPDAVFPALHGPPGEDGTVQGLLTMLGLPFVGSNVHGSAVAMDKLVAKQIFRAAGLPLADDLVVRRSDDLGEQIERIVYRFGTDVVVKPVRQGSALGVTLVHDSQQLQPALETALEFDAAVLVEEFIVGREMTAGVLDRVAEDGRVTTEGLPVIEIVTPEGTWYDYEHRYTAGESDHVIPAGVPEHMELELRRIATTAHAWLGCRDLSRADFVVADDGRIVLLEVNTLPGMTPTSLYPDAARAVGIDFEALVALLVTNALRRGPDLA